MQRGLESWSGEEGWRVEKLEKSVLAWNKYLGARAIRARDFQRCWFKGKRLVGDDSSERYD